MSSSNNRRIHQIVEDAIMEVNRALEQEARANTRRRQRGDGGGEDGHRDVRSVSVCAVFGFSLTLDSNGAQGRTGIYIIIPRDEAGNDDQARRSQPREVSSTTIIVPRSAGESVYVVLL